MSLLEQLLRQGSAACPKCKKPVTAPPWVRTPEGTFHDACIGPDDIEALMDQTK